MFSKVFASLGLITFLHFSSAYAVGFYQFLINPDPNTYESKWNEPGPNKSVIVNGTNVRIDCWYTHDEDSRVSNYGLIKKDDKNTFIWGEPKLKPYVKFMVDGYGGGITPQVSNLEINKGDLWIYFGINYGDEGLTNQIIRSANKAGVYTCDSLVYLNFGKQI